MEIINRIAVVLTPRRRFFEWVNGMPDADTALPYEDRKEYRTLYLLAGEEDATVDDLIDENWDDLFVSELASWYTDSAVWPTNRSAHTFRDWFEVDLIDTVADLDPEEPFTVTEQMRTRCSACGTELDDTQMAVALRQDGSSTRWSAEEMDAWQTRDAEEDDLEDPACVVLALRCCSDDCATRIVENFERAGQTDGE